jgi:hypothetical protein
MNALNGFLTILESAITGTRAECAPHNLDPSNSVVMMGLSFDAIIELRNQINDAKALTGKLDIAESRLAAEQSTVSRFRDHFLAIRNALERVGNEHAHSGSIRIAGAHHGPARSRPVQRGHHRHGAELPSVPSAARRRATAGKGLGESPAPIP